MASLRAAEPCKIAIAVQPGYDLVDQRLLAVQSCLLQGINLPALGQPPQAADDGLVAIALLLLQLKNFLETFDRFVHTRPLADDFQDHDTHGLRAEMDGQRRIAA